MGPARTRRMRPRYIRLDQVSAYSRFASHAGSRPSALPPHRKRWALKPSLRITALAAITLLLTACQDTRPTSPAIHAIASAQPARWTYLSSNGSLPAVKVDESPRGDVPDSVLVSEVRGAGGLVFIALKAPAARRSSVTGIVAALSRDDAMSARAVIQAQGARIVRTYRFSTAIVAQIDPDDAPRLRNEPVVDYVEAVGSYRSASTGQDTAWGLWRTGVPRVWSGNYGPPRRGEGVIVTVLDHGVDYQHEYGAGGDGPAGLVRCISVLDATCWDQKPSSDLHFGHGAEVMGIIAARDNGLGVIGVATNLGALNSIKVCGEESAGGCRADWIAAGLDSALAWSNHRQIVNLSMGGCHDFKTIKQAIGRLVQAGVLLVSAAGNWSQGETYQQVCGTVYSNNLGNWSHGVQYPAAYPGVMAVSGTLSNDAFAEAPPLPRAPTSGSGCWADTSRIDSLVIISDGGQDGACLYGYADPQCTAGSRYGPEVQIAAPFWTETTIGLGRFGARCGTSLSAPFVTGIAALLWSQNLDWTADQVRTRLRSTAVYAGAPDKFGSGRINALFALYSGAAPPAGYVAQINGPSSVKPGATCGWYATSTSGYVLVSQEWKVNNSVVSGEPYLHYTAGSTDFSLTVSAVDEAGFTAWDSRTIVVSMAAPDCFDQ